MSQVVDFLKAVLDLGKAAIEAAGRAEELDKAASGPIPDHVIVDLVVLKSDIDTILPSPLSTPTPTP